MCSNPTLDRKIKKRNKKRLHLCTFKLTPSSLVTLHPGILHIHDNIHSAAIKNTHMTASSFWKVLVSLYAGCCSIREHLSDASQKFYSTGCVFSLPR